jgi:hypothetical protein
MMSDEAFGCHSSFIIPPLKQDSMPDMDSPPVSRLAVASLVLGLLTPLLWGLAGVPALVFGLQGLRAVNASDGRLRGRRLAVAGMALGACATALSVAGVAALVLIGVNDKGRRLECQDNLRQIGQAVTLSYEDHNQRFPPAALPNPALPPEQRLSWLAGLLPYMDLQKDGTGRWQALARGIDLQQGWEAPANRPALSTNVARFLCPSCPAFDPLAARGLTHYVGLTGISTDAVWYVKDTGLPALGASTVGLMDAPLGQGPVLAAATLFPGRSGAGFFGYARLIGEADLGGGKSNTLITTETTLRNGPWLAANDATLRGLDRQALPYIGPGRQFGGCHARGLHLLFADGSCRFYNEVIENQAFERLIPLLREEP